MVAKGWDFDKISFEILFKKALLVAKEGVLKTTSRSKSLYGWVEMSQILPFVIGNGRFGHKNGFFKRTIILGCMLV